MRLCVRIDTTGRYTYVRNDTINVNRNRNSYFDHEKRKQQPLQGDDASTAEPAHGRVGRDEQAEARRANSTPDGPHLELRYVVQG